MLISVMVSAGIGNEDEGICSLAWLDPARNGQTKSSEVKSPGPSEGSKNKTCLHRASVDVMTYVHANLDCFAKKSGQPCTHWLSCTCFQSLEYAKKQNAPSQAEENKTHAQLARVDMA